MSIKMAKAEKWIKKAYRERNKDVADAIIHLLDGMEG